MIQRILALVCALASFPALAGTVVVKSANYINYPGTTFTETFSMSYQLFTGSTDCSSGAGPVVNVQHVDSVTGTSFPISAGSSFRLEIPPGSWYEAQSEQIGPFVGWGWDYPANDATVLTLNNRTICSSGFDDTRAYVGRFYAGIETFDACGAPKTVFAPGETMQVKVSGGLTFEPEQLRFFIAGGSPNECTQYPTSGFVHVDSDPWTVTFTIPASDADLPSYCAPSGTQHVTGMWRTLVNDSSCGCNRAQTNFTVADDAPPSSCAISCPPDVTTDAAPGTCGANVSFTPPSGPGTVTCSQASGSFFPVGTTTVTCSSTLGTSCDFVVTVNDAEGPAIGALTASATALWPPNHQLVDVAVSWSATDCGSADCALSVSSSEPANGLGDGDVAPDFEVVDAHHVRLRAERAGGGSGRVYTITLTCTDGGGNTSAKSATVKVPKSQK